MVDFAPEARSSTADPGPKYDAGCALSPAKRFHTHEGPSSWPSPEELRLRHVTTEHVLLEKKVSIGRSAGMGVAAATAPFGTFWRVIMRSVGGGQKKAMVCAVSMFSGD